MRKPASATDTGTCGFVRVTSSEEGIEAISVSSDYVSSMTTCVLIATPKENDCAPSRLKEFYLLPSRFSTDQSIVSPTVICIVPTVLESKSMIAVRLALGRMGDETEANESTTVEYVSTPNTPVASNTNEAEDEVSMGRCTSKAITFVPSCTPEVV